MACLHPAFPTKLFSDALSILVNEAYKYDKNEDIDYSSVFIQKLCAKAHFSGRLNNPTLQAEFNKCMQDNKCDLYYITGMDYWSVNFRAISHKKSQTFYDSLALMLETSP